VYLIGRNRFRVLIAISLAVGFLFVEENQVASAQISIRDERGYLVDGGNFLEEYDQKDVIDEELEYKFTQHHLAQGYSQKSIENTDSPIRIMPLGDSITKGTGTCSEPDTYLNCIGYRQDLWNALVGDGYSVDFVGSQGTAFQYQYSFDNDHEGHGGKTADWIRDRVYGPSDHFLLDNPADIVLLHIGTNDINSLPLLGDANDIVTEVSQILDKIELYETDQSQEVWVILARIINRSDPLSEKGQQTTDFNQDLQTMAASRIAGGDKIFLVDMESALIYPDDLGDNLHPNEAGYSKMASVWFSALEQVIFAIKFGERVVLPVIIR
jgi:lysophospholipase L1-like esterase